MAAANIAITSAAITPNPVYTGNSYTLSVQIQPAGFVLGDDACRIIDSDGAYIEVPEQVIYVLSDSDGAAMTDNDNTLIDMEG